MPETYAPQRQSCIIHANAFDSEGSGGMRAFKVKTNIEVNKQKGDGGVENDGINDFMAWENPIQGASYIASPSEADRSKEVNEVHNTSETFLASDVPELVVFIQESDYQSVKDIFIDREVPSRSWLNKDIYSKSQTDVDGDSKEPIKTLRIMSSISNEIEQDFQNYVRKQHALENLMEDGEEDSDGSDDHLLVSLNPAKPSATESIDDNGQLSEVSCNSEAESGSNIHLSDSSLTTISSLEEFLQGSFAISPLSSPIPCSGSISLRSTSSTASSFAFPIFPQNGMAAQIPNVMLMDSWCDVNDKPNNNACHTILSQLENGGY
ncbi:hypothetical protein REPUB_Repub08aG0053000 [Reevesia pubescens]